MGTAPAPTVLASGFACAENARWHDGRLYFSDMYGRVVVAVTEQGQQEIVAHVPDVPTGLGWLPDGRLLIATQRGRAVLRQENDGALVVHADLAGVVDSDLNDMWVDDRGNAYVGSFGFDPGALMTEAFATHTDHQEALVWAAGRVGQMPGALCLITPDGTIQVAADSILVPNGLTFSADRTRLYVAESFGPALLSFGVGSDGTLSDRESAALAFQPDGMSVVDAEGSVWIADPEGHAAVRVTPTGRIQERIETSQKCLAVALGGADGHMLFLCTTHSNDPEQSVAEQRSRIETLAVAVGVAR